MDTTSAACEYGLDALPEGVILMRDDHKDARGVAVVPDGAILWSGCYPIPQIGDRVAINFNELGTGIVESYFVEHGFCGLTVRLDNPPAWKVRQHAGTRHEGIAMVFGAELKRAG